MSAPGSGNRSLTREEWIYIYTHIRIAGLSERAKLPALKILVCARPPCLLSDDDDCYGSASETNRDGSLLPPIPPPRALRREYKPRSQSVRMMEAESKDATESAATQLQRFIRVRFREWRLLCSVCMCGAACTSPAHVCMCADLLTCPVT